MSRSENNLFEELKKKYDELFCGDANGDAVDSGGSVDLSGEDDSEEDPDNIVVLYDKEWHACKFEFLDLIENKGEEFGVLLSADDEEPDTDEGVILRLEDNNPEEGSYASVGDVGTLKAVFETFKEKYKDEFNFVD